VNRRTFISATLLSGAPGIVNASAKKRLAAASGFAPSAQPGSDRVALYVNVGRELMHYDVDIANAALIKRSSITLPSVVQYGWPHSSRRYLYVACGISNNQQQSAEQYLAALRIDPLTGELSMHGEPVQLPARPIHVSTDIPSEHVLVAFNAPSGVRVFRINQDFAIGQEIPQPGVKDSGIYAHQIRVTPDNRHAILVTRGISATPTKTGSPGALKMFDYQKGLLTNETSIAPEENKGFHPRHLDFHPTKPWVYVNLEIGCKMYTYRMRNGRLAADTVYRNDTLAEPLNKKAGQISEPIRVHPNGRFVYVANRADGTIDFNGKKVFSGGENNVAVYSINQASGEPCTMQHVDTRGFAPHAFDIDPGGRLLVVYNNIPMNVHEEGDHVRAVSPCMVIFRIHDDGRLSYEQSYDLDGDKYTNYWIGMVPLE
jgi:6-phosphogluconolactonase